MSLLVKRCLAACTADVAIHCCIVGAFMCMLHLCLHSQEPALAAAADDLLLLALLLAAA
jgi:hypothetical protein